MGNGRIDSDVLVIGSGPGGTATAITCAAMGLRVRLLERNAGPIDKPGETLHPGVETVLEQLGVADRLPAVTGSRHAGIRIRWSGRDRYEAYGQDEKGPWLGYQVCRADFDAMLLDRAREVGVKVLQPCIAGESFRNGANVVGVESTLGVMTTRTLVNASGRSHRFKMDLGTDRQQYSPSLVARYGYAAGSRPELTQSPILTGDHTGWLWQAMIRPGVFQWTRVSLDGARFPHHWRPDEFEGLRPIGRPKGADVTWRLAKNAAQPGWFAVGDAAAVLDPTSANGVLRALLSGIMAGKLIGGIHRGVLLELEAAEIYNDWLADWFIRTAQTLAGFYRSLGVTGFVDTNNNTTSIRNQAESLDEKRVHDH